MSAGSSGVSTSSKKRRAPLSRSGVLNDAQSSNNASLTRREGVLDFTQGSAKRLKDSDQTYLEANDDYDESTDDDGASQRQERLQQQQPQQQQQQQQQQHEEQRVKRKSTRMRKKKKSRQTEKVLASPGAAATVPPHRQIKAKGDLSQLSQMNNRFRSDLHRNLASNTAAAVGVAVGGGGGGGGGGGAGSSSSAAAAAAAAEQLPAFSVPTKVNHLVRKSWTVSRCSPLYKFETSAQALQVYEQEIMRALHPELANLSSSGGASAAFASKLKYAVRCSLLKPFDSEQDASTLGICFSVFDLEQAAVVTAARDLSRRPAAFRGPAFCLVLGSFDGQQDDAAEVTPTSFTDYPLVLARGRGDQNRSTLGLAKMREPLMQWVQQRFDCLITPLPMATHHLQTMIEHWGAIGAEDGTYEAMRSILLEYMLPPFVRGLRRIVIKVPPYSVRAISRRLSALRLRKIQLNARNEDGAGSSDAPEPLLDSSDVSALEVINEHILNHFHMDLGSCRVVRVATQFAVASLEGRLKLVELEGANPILDFYTNIARQNTTND